MIVNDNDSNNNDYSNDNTVIMIINSLKHSIFYYISLSIVSTCMRNGPVPPQISIPPDVTRLQPALHTSSLQNIQLVLSTTHTPDR